MIERARDLLRLDLEQADLRRGLIGMIAIVAAVVFVAVFGIIGMTAAFAALLVIVADVPGAMRDRVTGVVVLTAGGTLVALAGVWAGTDHVWVATLLTFAVTLAGTLAAAYGEGAAIRGLLLTLWAILTLSLSGNEEPAGAFAAAFAVGGALAALILWLQARTSGPLDDAPERRLGEPAAPAAGPSPSSVIRSSLGWFSLVRGASVAVATALGIELFPDHAIWAALTVLLVLRPRAGETVDTGVLRTLGTLVGVLVAEGVIERAGDSDVIVVLGFLAAAFGMMALQRVNYAVFVLCLTALLVLIQQLIGEDADEAAWDRLLATLLGAGISFAALALGRVIVQRRSPDPRSRE